MVWGGIFIELYADAKTRIAVVSRNEISHQMIKETIALVKTISGTVESLRAKMNELASQLPEYQEVMAMYGAGKSTGPQLIAEIGDIRRFHSKKALVAFAGLDSPPDESGQVTNNHKRMTKRGSPALRRTLFLVMGVILQNAPVNEPVYQFMDKKRAEGKPYRVYMMASANKFLRIYYASVKAHLDALEEA